VLRSLYGLNPQYKSKCRELFQTRFLCEYWLESSLHNAYVANVTIFKKFEGYLDP
jgi:hypothetical protein